VLKEARTDDTTVKKDYNRQLESFKQFHKRDPTDDELVAADMTMLPDAFHNHMDDLTKAIFELTAELEPEQEEPEESEDEGIQVLPAYAQKV